MRTFYIVLAQKIHTPLIRICGQTAAAAEAAAASMPQIPNAGLCSPATTGGGTAPLGYPPRPHGYRVGSTNQATLYNITTWHSKLRMTCHSFQPIHWMELINDQSQSKTNKYYLISRRFGPTSCRLTAGAWANGVLSDRSGNLSEGNSRPDRISPYHAGREAFSGTPSLNLPCTPSVILD